MNVTVIIAPTNPHVDLRPAVESLLAQTFSDFEIIVVGGSIELSDPRIKFIQNEKKSARNVGLEHARGDYIYFMDADGLIFENAFELLIDAAERSNADIVHSSSYVERDGDDVSIVPSSAHSPIGVNLYRREFLERTGVRFPASLDGDEAFCYAASCLTDRIVRVDEYFYVSPRREAQSDEEPIYVRDLNRDEIRAGFLVTSQRKRLWNAEIGLIRELDRLCRKHNLHWFAHTGTMLGAARHKGFIPWDDDVDIVMFRPDYEKFKRLAPRELKARYFLDVWYNYAWEGEPNPENLTVVSKQLLTKIHENAWWWPTSADFIKLRDHTTTLIQWPDRRDFPQGIWIDIFPFDPLPPFDDQQQYVNIAVKKELFMVASHPHIVRAAIKNGETLLINRDKLEQLLALPFKQRAIAYEEFVNQTYFEAERSARLFRYFTRENPRILNMKDMRETIEMPFEESTVRMPRGYEAMLTRMYGDWHELMFSVNHMKAASTDMSSQEFFARVSPAIKEFSF